MLRIQEFSFVVPEPEGLVLAALGLAGLAAWRWRRRFPLVCLLVAAATLAVHEARAQSAYIELTEVLLQSPTIERIVSQGHASPEGFWYDQDEDEWVWLVQGAARLRFEDDVAEMRSDDYLQIAAHGGHVVEWTDPEQKTVWLAVHY